MLTKPTLKLCSTFTEAQDSDLKLCGWYHHGGFVEAMTNDQMDDATPHEAYDALDRDVQATLKEARQVRELFSNFDGNGVREFKMILYPFLDAFQSANLLVPKTKIEMAIDLNDANFYFIGQTARAKLDESAFRITFHLKEYRSQAGQSCSPQSEKRITERNTCHVPLDQNRSACLGHTRQRGITQHV